MPRMVMVDYKACTGCRICEMVCSLKNEGAIAPSLSRIRVYAYPPGLDIPTVCVQCIKAACAEVCPQKAITRNNELDILTVDRELCTGCGICVKACPSEAIRVHPEKGTAFKCELCNGEAPCVEACPADALSVYSVPFDTRVFAKPSEKVADELKESLLAIPEGKGRTRLKC
ncbi:4Fe-4S dicluster domain-containing protein [Candidatus Bathyarchaeota archaeon]|nr:MAG: 4Fe-4S dicluster domain-containing protein [Candidatus Bathyarchaeota archaeon]